MRKAMSLLAALFLFAGLGVGQAHAQSPDRAVLHTSSVKVPAATISAQWTLNTWKLGGLPAGSTLCVANGIASDYNYKGLIEAINNSTYGPNISVLNRCDGYSITNRMTIESYVQNGTTACAKWTNTGKVWDSAQGKYIWNQNVVLWYNNSTYCIGDGTNPARSHRVGMFMEYTLGLNYDTAEVHAVICSAASCYYDVPYVTPEDQRRLGYVYGREA